MSPAPLSSCSCFASGAVTAERSGLSHDGKCCWRGGITLLVASEVSRRAKLRSGLIGVNWEVLQGSLFHQAGASV